MTACWSTSKSGKKHPYYLCFTKGCESFRKSIPRAKIEGEFETLLAGVRPTRSLFDLTKAMFKDAWERQRVQASAVGKSIRRQILQTEQQVSHLLDRIVEATNPRVIAAYEERIASLERDKLVMAERLQSSGKPLRPFEEMFELSLGFLANPCNIWGSWRLEDRLTVLKLTFAERLTYNRNEGFRTPETSLIFKALEGIGTGNFKLAVGAVTSEPVSGPISLIHGNLQGNSADSVAMAPD